MIIIACRDIITTIISKPTVNKKMKKISIYSTPTCVYCNMAKNFFKANGFEYEEYNVATDLNKRKEMIDKTGQMGVPVIDVDGDVVVGFDESKLGSMLGVK